MKKIFILGLIVSASAVYSQVGIDTENPKATLDVVAKPDNSSKTDGFIAPRISKAKLQAKDAKYGTDQNAAIIYVDNISGSATSDKVSLIDVVGYYYFDKDQGTNGRWVKMSGSGGTGTYQEPWYNEGATTPATSNTANIYQNAKVGIGNFAVENSIKADLQISNNSDNADTNNTSGKVEIAKLGLGGKSRLTPGAYLKATTSANSRYNDQVDLEFGTSNGGGGNASTKMILLNNGNVGIGTATPQANLEARNTIRFPEVKNNTLAANTYKVMGINSTTGDVGVIPATTPPAIFKQTNSSDELNMSTLQWLVAPINTGSAPVNTLGVTFGSITGSSSPYSGSNNIQYAQIPDTGTYRIELYGYYNCTDNASTTRETLVHVRMHKKASSESSWTLVDNQRVLAYYPVQGMATPLRPFVYIGTFAANDQIFFDMGVQNTPGRGTAANWAKPGTNQYACLFVITKIQ